MSRTSYKKTFLSRADIYLGYPRISYVAPISEIRTLLEQSPDTVISEIKHPEYSVSEQNWYKWRMVMESGDEFVEAFTKKFSRREDPQDFERRKTVTPVPAFAKSAILEIKNSIFQRLVDVRRVGGPNSYQSACKGELGGVDRHGSQMTWFIGHYVIPELLSMRKVGVYVDNGSLGVTLADKGNQHPYLYTYHAEDIRSWAYTKNGERTVFKDVLLREYQYEYYDGTYLPAKSVVRFRRLFIEDNRVQVQFYDEYNNKVGDQKTLNLTEIPFVVFELSDSLLKDVANHQIALLNLESSDMSYSLLGNFPLYTEQYDSAAENPYIDAAKEAWQAEENLTPNPVPTGWCPPTKKPAKPRADVGSDQGRRYSKGLERPGFIHPSSEPIKASMEKQGNLKEDIRKLIHLAISSLQPKAASAEAKKMDQSGLEAGLSYIGLELQQGEQQIAHYWSMYEGETTDPKINYPDKWSVKTDDEKNAEVSKLEDIRDSVPSRTFQKEMTKQIALTMLEDKVDRETMQKILSEIQEATTITSDPVTIIEDFKAGFLSGKTGSIARGYPESEYKQAVQDHADRAAAIVAAQTARKGGETVSASSKDPQAAGVPELSSNPNAASQEKQGLPKRGEGQ